MRPQVAPASPAVLQAGPFLHAPEHLVCTALHTYPADLKLVGPLLPYPQVAPASPAFLQAGPCPMVCAPLPTYPAGLQLLGPCLCLHVLLD